MKPGDNIFIIKTNLDSISQNSTSKVILDLIFFVYALCSPGGTALLIHHDTSMRSAIHTYASCFHMFDLAKGRKDNVKGGRPFLPTMAFLRGYSSTRSSTTCA